LLPFDFIVEGLPVSQQTRRRQDRLPPWRATVRAAARAGWGEAVPPVEERISIEITHFFEGAPADFLHIRVTLASPEGDLRFL
jgi:hypothetical protein